MSSGGHRGPGESPSMRPTAPVGKSRFSAGGSVSPGPTLSSSNSEQKHGHWCPPAERTWLRRLKATQSPVQGAESPAVRARRPAPWGL